MAGGFSSTPDFPSPLAMRGRVLIAADPLLLLCPQVGSFCSGMGIDFLALREVLGRKFVESAVEHTFVCEKNKSASAFVKDNFAPKLFLADVMSDAFLSAPRVDIFTAGFPCQPFSPAGLGEGEADQQGRGLMIWQILRYFRVSPPSLFILENVETLLTDHPDTFWRIIEELRMITDAQGEPFFHVDWRVLNSKIYGGVPQNRKRLYIVGGSREHGTLSSEFWPEALPTPTLTSILDEVSSKRRPQLPTSPVALEKYKKVMKELKAKRIRPRQVPICIDFDAHKARWKHDMSFLPHGNPWWIRGLLRDMSRAQIYDSRDDAFARH